MELPDWVLEIPRDELPASASLVLAAVFRHGGGSKREADDEGRIRAVVRCSMAELARLAGLGLRTVEDLVPRLVALGYLGRSGGGRGQTPTAYWAYYERSTDRPTAESAGPDGTDETGTAERAGDFPPPGRASAEPADYPVLPPLRTARFAGHSGVNRIQSAESADSAGSAEPAFMRARANGGGGDDPFLTQNQVDQDLITTTTEIPREQILRALHSIRMSSIGGILKAYGWGNVYGALEALHQEMERTVVRNPAGFVVGALEKWKEFPTPSDGRFLAEIIDPSEIEARRRKAEWGFGGKR